jgi:uncharacterized protein (DUF849 family)
VRTGPDSVGRHRHDRPVLLKGCLNGARRPTEHPALPITPDQLAADVRAVVAAGAGAVHLHVKDAEGADTLGAAELAEVLRAVRGSAPGVPVGVTTGAWAEADPERRVAAIESWTALPDFASVNWHEPGAERVAGALLVRGVAVEAGLWSAEPAAAWLASSYRDLCSRVLLELPRDPGPAGTAAVADELLALLGTDGEGRTASGVPVLLHGEGTSAWPALRHAARRGLSTRIGLEDVLELPDGSAAPDNTALVLAAVVLLGRPPPEA